MENTFYLEIITPDRQFYTGPATNLTMPALDGEYGVQPGHEPVVTALRPGTGRGVLSYARWCFRYALHE